VSSSKKKNHSGTVRARVHCRCALVPPSLVVISGFRQVGEPALPLRRISATTYLHRQISADRMFLNRCFWRPVLLSANGPNPESPCSCSRPMLAFPKVLDLRQPYTMWTLPGVSERAAGPVFGYETGSAVCCSWNAPRPARWARGFSERQGAGHPLSPAANFDGRGPARADALKRSISAGKRREAPGLRSISLWPR